MSKHRTAPLSKNMGRETAQLRDALLGRVSEKIADVKDPAPVAA